ncbi:MAG: site-specific integrase [Dehalococcoidia bacterium]|nr:site-specific integrase [Dehalococcoidia bacterium]
MARRANGEGSISRTTDGRWVARVTTGYDKRGRAIRKALYAKTRAEASRRLMEFHAQHARGLSNIDGRTTCGEWFQRWLSDTVRVTVRPSTFRAYESNVRLHLIPELGRITLAKLAAAHVRRLIAKKLDEGLSPRSVQFLRANLRAAVQQAVADGLIGRNVVDFVKGPPVPRFEVRPLDAGQLRTLLDGVHGDRLGALLICAVTLGLRQGELLALAWEDVDLEVRSARIVRTLGRDRTLGEPKSRSSRRVVPLSVLAVDALIHHKERQELERDFAGRRWREHGLVFTTTIGTPLDARNVGRYLRDTLERLELPHQRFHDLRHACASLLLGENVHPRVVMDLLGHSQISVTMNLYSHVMPAMQREAADRLDAVLGRE